MSLGCLTPPLHCTASQQIIHSFQRKPPRGPRAYTWAYTWAYRQVLALKDWTLVRGPTCKQIVSGQDRPRAWRQRRERGSVSPTSALELSFLEGATPPACQEGSPFPWPRGESGGWTFMTASEQAPWTHSNSGDPRARVGCCTYGHFPRGHEMRAGGGRFSPVCVCVLVILLSLLF